MTNGDLIRDMDDEELAAYLYLHDFCKEPFKTNSQFWCDGDCDICIKNFLEEDSEDVPL